MNTAVASEQGDSPFHFITIGWDTDLVARLCDPVAQRSGDRFSHLLHPRYTRDAWDGSPATGLYFFWDRTGQPLPVADRALLASLERPGVPTVHNMILSDRVISKLPYEAALQYVTFLARRIEAVLTERRPDVVIGAFDAIHGSVGLAVARRLGIPWFAMHFSVIPQGMTCFCDRMAPAARVQMGMLPPDELRALAESALSRFENRDIRAYAYIAPASPSVLNVPQRLAAVWRTWRRASRREFLQYTEASSVYSVTAAVTRMWRGARARRATRELCSIKAPPSKPYVLFGLHLQPESSIDVWAPFYSNQPWVIELLARSIPPSHRLLVKIHKSDISNHSRERLQQLRSLPGVELIEPFADARAFIEKADLVIGIQGTMGLEAALLGKPVIMLGDSPLVTFPTVARIGAISDLPELIRRSLAQERPSRSEIVEAYATYLAPMMPASLNVWTREITPEQLENYVAVFSTLSRFVCGSAAKAAAR